MSTTRKSLGSPFQSGTVANLILGLAILTVWLYLFVSNDFEKPFTYIVMGMVGLAGFVVSYFKYRKLKGQHGIELLDDNV